MRRKKNVQSNKYRCLECGEFLMEPKDRFYLTSYPIQWVYECPRCKSIHFLLADEVLCTEKEFDRRICRNYVAV